MNRFTKYYGKSALASDVPQGLAELQRWCGQKQHATGSSSGFALVTVGDSNHHGAGTITYVHQKNMTQSCR